jgi:hypothetical protein
MIVSLPTGGKGMGLFVHDFMGNSQILKVLAAFPKNAVSFMFNSNCCYDEEIICPDCSYDGLRPQSGEVGRVSDAGSNIQEQNVGFVDSEVDVKVDLGTNLSLHSSNPSSNVMLGQFLSRPVQIYSLDWQIGTGIDYQTEFFNPWLEYFNTTSIKRKLDNYYLLRCNLHLKFVVNASPFYYGCLLAAYQPLGIYAPAPVVAEPGSENIPLSQRPHIYIYPQNSQAGEMILPFFYHKEWIDATSSGDLTNMGTINFSSLTNLLNANGLTTETINIKVYAWADNLELAGPTISLAVQSGNDEYSSKGLISRPASAIARSMGMLSGLPVIGNFATATSYAAGAIADIAALFGYTNVPVIDDVHAFRSKPYPNLASTDIGTPVEKLTIDAKNELSIDSKICSPIDEDELIISKFCSRESFIFSSTWEASYTEGESLFYSFVSPSCFARVAITGGYKIYSTPMDHVSRCFNFWRGDIIYRFKFILSKYHTGRVQINWDPKGGIGTLGDYTPETYTKIVDVSVDNEVEIRVPYTQALSYLTCNNATGSTFAKTSTAISGVGSRFNGIITMRVLTAQTSPVASADIKVLVYARAAENIEFASPVDRIASLAKYSPYAPQSGIQYDIDNSPVDIGLQVSKPDPNINLLYMGESCVSLRQLMRRSVLYKRNVSDTNLATDAFYFMKTTLNRSPQFPGYDPVGVNTATGIISGLSTPYNWTNWSITTWFSMCFIGSKGSYHYTVNPFAKGTIFSSTVSRSNDQLTTYTTSANTDIVTASNIFNSQVGNGSEPAGLYGLSMTNQLSQAGHMVSLPLYNNYKFISNSVLDRTEGASFDGTNIDTMVITSTSAVNSVDKAGFVGFDMYMSAGTDFSLIFFLNVPTYFEYSSVPNA